MAIAVYSPDFTGSGPKASLAAPTVSELIDTSGGDQFLLVVVGATPCTVTITPGLPDPFGRTPAVLSSGAITSQTIVIRITKAMANQATGIATVAFSSVATVTACLLRP